MNIDDLTIGQIKGIQALQIGSVTPRLSSPTGRAVVVVDRGWIFAGDMSVTSDGYMRLDNAVHVFRWESVGFAAVVKDPKGSKADIRLCDPVEVPMDSIIFRIPVEAGWGMK